MIDYRFIGWCTEGKHDKVWIAIKLSETDLDTYAPGKVLTLWGRRGSALRSKIVNDDQNLFKLIEQKRRKGYDKLSTEYLDRVYPEFKEDLEKKYIWSMLAL